MRPILILDGERFARTLSTGISSRVAQDLIPILRRIAREQDQLMTISEDILTEATNISDNTSALVSEVDQNNEAIDAVIALIESMEVDPAQEAQLQDALAKLQGAGQTLSASVSKLDADTTKLADVTAAPPTP